MRKRTGFKDSRSGIFPRVSVDSKARAIGINRLVVFRRIYVHNPLLVVRLDDQVFWSFDDINILVSTISLNFRSWLGCDLRLSFCLQQNHFPLVLFTLTVPT